MAAAASLQSFSVKGGGWGRAGGAEPEAGRPRVAARRAESSGLPVHFALQQARKAEAKYCASVGPLLAAKRQARDRLARLAKQPGTHCAGGEGAALAAKQRGEKRRD